MQLCMFLVIAMGKILCYDNCMMKNILKNKKFWKIICILAIIAYTAKNLFIGADTDEGYGIMAGYRLAMGDRLLLEMWEPHQTSAIFTAVFIRLFVMLTGGVNYLNLFLRLVFFPIQACVSVFLYKTIRRTVPQMDENVAALMGLLYYVTTPKSIFIPEYSNLHNWFFALMVLCLLRYFGAKDSEGRQTAGELRWLVLALCFVLGAAMSACVQLAAIRWYLRHVPVLALGGGVVGDLAGFAAASYMRGVTFINCPTTTLSQIDSSIGGKTAINLAGTKNTVGAFYQPSLVVADPDTLKSLPERHFINGLAEAVKAGLIADEGLFELFETEDAHEKIEEIVYRSLVMKKNVVERDEREAGLRATLNFGHTLGHAIESANHLGGLYHGECVALGMLPMIEDASLRRRTRAVYKKLGLPSRIRYDGDEIFEFIRHDKKTGPDGAITVVKVPRLGECRLDKVPLEDLKAIIGEGVR